MAGSEDTDRGSRRRDPRRWASRLGRCGIKRRFRRTRCSISSGCWPPSPILHRLPQSSINRAIARGRPRRSAPSLIDEKYRIEGQLGHGGMGFVYRARHLELGKLFALKLVQPHRSYRPESLARFRIEAKHSDGSTTPISSRSPTSVLTPEPALSRDGVHRRHHTRPRTSNTGGRSRSMKLSRSSAGSRARWTMRTMPGSSIAT